MPTAPLPHRLLQNYARHFPLQQGKRRVIRAASGVLRGPRNRTTSLLHNGLQMRLDTSKQIQRELFYFGTYEDEECRLWMELARDAQVAFDVGGNVGLYSMLAASTNPAARVHTFEPTPHLVQAIQDNLRLNRLSNVVVNGVAVGSKSGEATLNLCTGADGTNEGMNWVSAEPETPEVGVSVSVVALDDYCRERGIEFVDVMKMDIEGGEYQALLGARGLLERGAIGAILLELSEWAAQRAGHSTQDIKRLLADHGYSLYRFEGGARIPLSLDSTDHGFNVLALAPAPA